MTDIYSTSEDFHWLAGREVYYPIVTARGKPVATLIVKLFGFDLAGIPDRSRDVAACLRSSLGHLKRDVERDYRGARNGGRSDGDPGLPVTRPAALTAECSSASARMPASMPRNT